MVDKLSNFKCYIHKTNFLWIDIEEPSITDVGLTNTDGHM